MTRTYIFKPQLEKLYYAILAVFLVCFVFACFGQFSFFGLSRSTLGFIRSFVFMNAIHTYLGLLMLFLIPEFRKVVIKRFRTRWGFFMIPPIALIFFGAYAKSIGVNFSSQNADLYIMILGVMMITHNSFQTKGLSLMYNFINKKNLDNSELEKHFAVEKTERLLFNLFIFFRAFCFLFQIYFFRELAASKYYVWLIPVALALLLIANTFRYPKIQSSNKRFFIFSLIFQALAFYFPAAIFFQTSLHGIEYSFITYTVTKKSTFKMTIPAIFIAASVLVTLSFFTIIYKSPEGSLVISDNLRMLGIALGFSVEYLHYFFDSQVFRLKDPLIKQSIGPLLAYDHQPFKRLG